MLLQVKSIHRLCKKANRKLAFKRKVVPGKTDCKYITTKYKTLAKQQITLHRHTKKQACSSIIQWGADISTLLHFHSRSKQLFENKSNSK